MYRVIDCNKCSTRVQDVGCRRGCACVGTGDIWERSVHTTQFCYKPKTVYIPLKIFLSKINVLVIGRKVSTILIFLSSVVNPQILHNTLCFFAYLKYLIKFLKIYSSHLFFTAINFLQVH